MNARLATIIGAVLFVVVIAAVSGFAGYQWCGKNYAEDLANHNARIAELTAAMLTQQATIQKFEDDNAQLVQDRLTANREKNDAIKTIDQHTETITRIQQELAQSLRSNMAPGADGQPGEAINPADLVIVRGSYFIRVFTEAVRAGGIPAKPPSSAISAQLLRIAYSDDTDDRARSWCDSEKCCSRIQPVRGGVQRFVADLH